MINYETASDETILAEYNKAIRLSFYYMAAEGNYNQEKQDRDENTKNIFILENEIRNRKLTVDFSQQDDISGNKHNRGLYIMPKYRIEETLPVYITYEYEIEAESEEEAREKYEAYEAEYIGKDIGDNVDDFPGDIVITEKKG